MQGIEATVSSVDRPWALPGPVASSIGPVTSLLICDDRGDVRHGFAQSLRRSGPISTAVDIRCVADGFALLDAFARERADLVMIGVHSASNTGDEAIRLLLGLHPSATAIIYGSIAEIDLLASAYAAGAGGLLLWEPDSAPRPAHPAVPDSRS